MNDFNKSKIAVLTLGCSKNVVDSEQLIGLLKKNNFDYTLNHEEADSWIINTCGFVRDAKEESMNLIVQAGRLKSQGKLKKVIVFGCFAQRYLDDLKANIKDIDFFFGVGSYTDIIRALKGKVLYGAERELITPFYTAYLKIGEGCNHGCAFCAIPLIKGKYKSREMSDILSEAKNLYDRGVKEINIIAQDTTYWGKDIYGKSRLPELIERISDIKFDWVRVLYTYPVGFPMDLIEVMADRQNVCKYLDMPLQHISDSVLKDMGRGINGQKIKDLISEIRANIPNITLRSTFITGFPTETEDNFKELLQFVKSVKLDRVGVFAYSPEEDTKAFKLGDPIPDLIKEKRVEKIMIAQQKISLEKNKKLIGETLKVLVDSEHEGAYIGRTERDAPEVDNSVIIQSKKTLQEGSFVNVKISAASEYDLIGELV